MESTEISQLSSHATANQNSDIEFLHWSDEDMIAEVRRRWEICARSLVDLAKIVCASLRRGIDLSFIDNPLLIDVLRKIEANQILPELAERFLMNTRLFEKLKNLPLEDQHKIAKTGMVEVAVRSADGGITSRQMSVVSLTWNQRRLVFSNGRIRSIAEQMGIIEDEAIPEEDPFEESVVSFKFPSVTVDFSKADARLLKEKADRSGGMSEFVKHAIKKMLG